MRAIVLLNADAGSMQSLRGEKTLHLVRDRFTAGGWSAQVCLLPSDAIDRALRDAITSSADAIVVGGGDGTVSRAVAAMAGNAKPLGILPLGTVNLLGRDLNIAGTLEDAIGSLCAGETRAIDLASVNGRPFHSLSGLGFFAHMAREREKMRRRWRLQRWITFAFAAARAFSKMGTLQLEIEIDGAVRPTAITALLVTNNRFSRDNWQRERLDEGVLEVHVLGDLPFWRRLRAGIDVMRGRWRDNPLIETLTVTSLVVRCKRSRLWIALDGELVRAPVPLKYDIKRAALKVRAPESPVQKRLS